ncbi:hypothetical protein KJ969_03495 [Patescibacteria group bacterium]|nr:hypothetical protein [Patescibacteria group bacterium]MBU1921941.1 hypothetical protein [Patescibacteria group bacterium]
MPAKKELLISELFLESATNRQTLNKVFNFEIPSSSHHGGGSVFGILKIDSIHPVYDRLIKNIIESIENFYQEEHELDFGQEFEKALQVINANISDFVSGENNPIDLEKLNIVITASSDQDMSFSFVGQVKIFYFQKQSGKGFQVFDLVRTLKADGQKINPNKLFENVMNGTIRPGDVVVTASPNLFEVFNEEELQPILISKKPDEAVAYLRNKLLEGSVKSGFTAVILKYHEEPVLVGQGGHSKNFQGSLEHLKATEDETNRYLLGKSPGRLASIISKITSRLSGLMPKAGSRYEQKIAPPPRELGTQIIKFFTWVGALIAKAAVGLVHWFRDAFIFITNFRGKRKEIVAARKDKLQSYGNESVSWFNKLGKMSRNIFIGAMVLVLIFVGSLIYLNFQQTREQEQNLYNQRVITITQKKDEAESSLIYGDNDRARELVSEALALIQDLPERKGEQQEIKQSLVDEMERLKKELRQEVIPQDLEKISSLPLGSQEQLIDFSFILFGGDGELLILSKQKNLFVWKETEAAWQEIGWENPDIEEILCVAKSDSDGYAILDQRPGISEIDISNLSWQELEFNAATEQKSFQAAATYSSRLYALDPEANQIFKHNRAQSGFGTGSAWIASSGADISDAVSLTIDGSVYVLKADGQIYKFYTGEKQNWAASTIEPALTNPIKILTGADTDNIYILEPTNSRVVVFDENGKLVNQYIIDGAQGLKDFYLDDKTIWILADNGVWKFTI